MAGKGWERRINGSNRTPASAHSRRNLRCAASRKARLPEDARNILVLHGAGSIARHQRDVPWNFAKRAIVTHDWAQRLGSPAGEPAVAYNRELGRGRPIATPEQDEVVLLPVYLLNDRSKGPYVLRKKLMVKNWVEQLWLPGEQFQVVRVSEHLNFIHAGRIQIGGGLRPQNSLVY